jgi:hypothetical protein
MGGMLATGALSLQGFLSRHIRSVTMLGSGCFGAGSWHSALKPIVLGLCVRGFPGGLAAGLFSKLIGTWASIKPVEALFYWTGNTDVSVALRSAQLARRASKQPQIVTIPLTNPLPTPSLSPPSPRSAASSCRAASATFPAAWSPSSWTASTRRRG